MADPEENVALKAADFDLTDLTKAFNDAVAAQKAGDDDDFTAAVQSIKKVVDDAVGAKDDGKEDDGKGGEDAKPDPFEAVNQKYAKKGGA